MSWLVSMIVVGSCRAVSFNFITDGIGFCRGKLLIFLPRPVSVKL